MTFNDEPFDDQDGDGNYTEGVDIFIPFDPVYDINDDGEWTNDSTYDVLQYQWKIEIAYENLQSVIDDLYNDEQIVILMQMVI